MRAPDSPNHAKPQLHRHNGFTRPAAWLLHHGRSRRPMLRVVPDGGALYRIDWPDIGPSQSANLTRCKQAALEWAEHFIATEDRKNNAARRLKSLDNFSWSASPMRLNGAAYGSATPAHTKIRFQVDASDWRAMRDFCLKHEIRLRSRERVSMNSLKKWRGHPTPKQVDWLQAIYDRFTS